MQYTQEEISGTTGFDKGEKFSNEAEVREYFTEKSMRDMLGNFDDATITDVYGEVWQVDEITLSEMADDVIANSWHMA